LGRSSGAREGARRPGSDDLRAPRRGISHNEIEDAKPEDLTAGCNVLLNAVLDRANAVAPVG
jgi:hypothetical protein